MIYGAFRRWAKPSPLLSCPATSRNRAKQIIRIRKENNNYIETFCFLF
jgi:hypothetical protein